MDRMPSGIPDKFFDLTIHFEVIKIDRTNQDENINERIQREGARFP
jgi:hypothetical protein